MIKQLILFLLLPLVFVQELIALRSENTKPNIIVFIADDAGLDFGCYGNKGIKTPNIDKIAKNGLRCDNAYLTAPQCSPSRTSILSGRFAHTIGTEDLHETLDNVTKIIPYYLQNEGYYTGLMLKSHIGKNGMNQFNWYDNGGVDWNNGTWKNKVLQNFQDFLVKSENKPFFLWLAFIDPHRPYADSLNGAPKIHRADDVSVPKFLVDNQETKEELALYYDEIHRMDKHIGIILQELENKGLAKNTLVIFLSDNGFPFPRGKATLYDVGIHTPLILKWEDHITPGSVYNNLLSVIDIAPTLLEAAGSPIPQEMYGKSFSKIFHDQTTAGSKYVFSERNWHDTEANMRSIRSDKYKLILNSEADLNLPFPITGDYWKSTAWISLLDGRSNHSLNDGQQRIFEFPRPGIEFYDLKNDPYELVNLNCNSKYFGIIQQMMVELTKWRKATKDIDNKKKADIVDRNIGLMINALELPRWETPTK